MAALTTSLFLRPAVRHAPSETTANRREAETRSANNLAPSGELQGFGDTDYHLLRSHALLERLQQAISTEEGE